MTDKKHSKVETTQPTKETKQDQAPVENTGEKQPVDNGGEETPGEIVDKFFRDLVFRDNSQCHIHITYNQGSGINWTLLEQLIPLMVKDSSITAAILAVFKVLKAAEQATTTIKI